MKLGGQFSKHICRGVIVHDFLGNVTTQYHTRPRYTFMITHRVFAAFKIAFQGRTHFIHICERNCLDFIKSHEVIVGNEAFCPTRLIVE